MWQTTWLKQTIGHPSVGQNIPPIMRSWHLPDWYQLQNDPTSPFFIPGKMPFYNQTQRNWTVLRPENNPAQIWVDTCGVIHIPELQISIEVWMDGGGTWFAPGHFQEITQIYHWEYGGIETVYHTPTKTCRMIVFPLAPEDGNWIGMDLNLGCQTDDKLKPMLVGWVIRPYTLNGMGRIYRMEYEDCWLKINNHRVMLFGQESRHTFFCNAGQGDIPDYLQSGNGNLGVRTADGTCTGLVGYSGLGDDLQGIKMVLAPQTSVWGKLRPFPVSWLAERHQVWSIRHQKHFEYIRAGKTFDSMMRCSIGHLQTFCSKYSSICNAFQIMALNRFGYFEQSWAYLKECLKNVAWDGSLVFRFVGDTQLPFIITDYYRFSNDLRTLPLIWPVLRKIGAYLQRFSKDFVPEAIHTTSALHHDQYREKMLWTCASLKELAFLGRVCGEFGEARSFYDDYLALLPTVRTILQFKKNQLPVYKNESREWNPVEEIGVMDNLTAFYPLQLWPEGEIPLSEQFQNIGKYLSPERGRTQGGYNGTDPGYLARMGQVLVREGLDYETVYRFLVDNSSTTWSWPEQVNPVTHTGIGNFGHDPLVLYQILLFFRNIFAVEENEILYLLPGVLSSNIWERPQLSLEGLPTRFGPISLKCHCIGRVFQMEYHPIYYRQPQKIRLRLQKNDRVISADKPYFRGDKFLEIDSDFSYLRIERISSS